MGLRIKPGLSDDIILALFNLSTPISLDYYYYQSPIIVPGSNWSSISNFPLKSALGIPITDFGHICLLSPRPLASQDRKHAR